MAGDEREDPCVEGRRGDGYREHVILFSISAESQRICQIHLLQRLVPASDPPLSEADVWRSHDGQCRTLAGSQTLAKMPRPPSLPWRYLVIYRLSCSSTSGYNYLIPTSQS